MKLSLTRMNLNSRSEKGIRDGNDFPISTDIEYKNMLHTDEIREMRSIFHWMYDVSPNDKAFVQKIFSCKTCGKTFGQDKLGMMCPKCGDRVEKREFDIRICGWISTHNYWFMTGICMIKVGDLIGRNSSSKRKTESKFDRLLKGNLEGFPISTLKDNWVDFIKVHGVKKKNTRLYEELINADVNTLFTNKLPVISSKLRPMMKQKNMGVDDIQLHGLNAPYSGISSIVDRLIKDGGSQVWDNDRCSEIQRKLYTIVEIAIDTVGGGKDKLIRGGLLSMRLPFIARLVIRPMDTDWVKANPKDGCRNDVCSMYYKGFVAVHKLEIKRILKSMNVPMPEIISMLNMDNEATPDQLSLLNKCLVVLRKEKRAYVLVNREPVIDFPSIVSLEVVRLTMEKTLGIPLTTLKGLRADFDGDVQTIGFIPPEVAEDIHRAMSPISYHLTYYGAIGKLRHVNDMQILLKKYLDY